MHAIPCVAVINRSSDMEPSTKKITVTIPEAIGLSGIGRSTFYEIFKTGKLKPRKQGKRTLILVCELEEGHLY